jgi:hypothetical protein
LGLEAFRSTTLAVILAEPTEGVPLCDFPAAHKRAAIDSN